MMRWQWGWWTALARLDGYRPAGLAALRGLGKDVWRGVDAQEYVDELRAEWNDRDASHDPKWVREVLDYLQHCSPAQRDQVKLGIALLKKFGWLKLDAMFENMAHPAWKQLDVPWLRKKGDDD